MHCYQSCSWRKFQMPNACFSDEELVASIKCQMRCSFKCRMHFSVSVSMTNAFHIHQSLFHFTSTDKWWFFGNRAGIMSHVFGSSCLTVQVLIRFGFLSSFHFTSIDHFSRQRFFEFAFTHNYHDETENCYSHARLHPEILGQVAHCVNLHHAATA